MSHNLSQPEEIELVLKELAANDLDGYLLLTGKRNPNRNTENNRYASHMPPYRETAATGTNS